MDQAEDGNTKRPLLIKHWCFTWNNPADDLVDHLVQVFHTQARRYVFQHENGESGTPHLQGYIEWNGRKRITAVTALCGRGAHWERCRNPDHAIAYCSKLGDDGRSADHLIWRRGFPEKLALLHPDGFRPWQRRLVDSIIFPTDDRYISWWWDERGGSGKTTVAKFICGSDRFNAIYVSGKANDVKYAISALPAERRDNLVVLFDFVRSSEAYVSYQSLEECKNGIFFNGKYESGMVIYNCPVVIVFANFPPERERLSLDRWDIHEIHML